MISDETYNDLMEFVNESEVEEIIEITGFGEDEILDDYLLFCSTADKAVNKESWTEYLEDTKNFFK